MVARKRKYRKISTSSSPVFEPQFENADELLKKLSETLTWYHYNKTERDATKYVKAYLDSIKYPKDKIQKILKLKKNLNRTFAWCCRIATVNPEVPDSIQKYLEKHLKILDTKFSQVKTEEVKEELPKRKKPTIQENIARQGVKFCWLLEDEVDQFIDRGCTKPIDPEKWFKAKNVKSQQCEKIREHFKAYSDDYKRAVKGEKDYLEAYSYLTKPQLKRAVKLLDKIISDSKVWEQKAKSLKAARRKPRKRKPRSPLKQIEKLQYMETTDDFGGLKSIPPLRIVGSSELWVFNSKTRVVSVYYCPNNHGFSIKGTTLQNFCIDKSKSKKVRKPEEVIKKILTLQKRGRNKILNELTTKEQSATGRINKDCILLRVDK